MEIGGEDIQTLSMDHYGLVAATCKDLGIAEKINNRIGSSDKKASRIDGNAAVAMIINGWVQIVACI